MKKLLIIVFMAFVTNAGAQITLLHTYDTAGTIGTGPNATGLNQLMMIKFEISGERYVKINRWGKVIDIYDMNHSLVKTISLDKVPLETSGRVGDILYISEQLFDTDTAIEFMFVFSNMGSYSITNIYKEDGTIIFSDTGAAFIKPNFTQQQLPIYNTSQSTIMILSYRNGQAKVFSLPGRLTTDIAESTKGLLNSSSLVSNPYPNPSQNTTQIAYTLPDGVNEGEIVFYNIQGNEIKRFKVDRTFNSLLISTADIAAGTYYYQLQTSSQASEGKKLIVIK